MGEANPDKSKSGRIENGAIVGSVWPYAVASTTVLCLPAVPPVLLSPAKTQAGPNNLDP